MATAALRPPNARYSIGAIAFHWAIAGLIAFNLFLGWRMGRLEGLDRFTTFQLHKSIGITVLALSVLRLAWRLTRRPPPHPASMRRWERALAGTVHWTFYTLMIGMPLTGWVIVSASPLNLPTLLYKVIPLPHIAAIHDRPLSTRLAIGNDAGAAHVTLAYLFAALILLHVAAALKHQFLDGDGVIGRMLPGRVAGRPALDA